MNIEINKTLMGNLGDFSTYTSKAAGNLPDAIRKHTWILSFHAYILFIIKERGVWATSSREWQ